MYDLETIELIAISTLVDGARSSDLKVKISSAIALIDYLKMKRTNDEPKKEES